MNEHGFGTAIFVVYNKHLPQGSIEKGLISSTGIEEPDSDKNFL